MHSQQHYAVLHWMQMLISELLKWNWIIMILDTHYACARAWTRLIVFDEQCMLSPHDILNLMS